MFEGIIGAFLKVIKYLGGNLGVLELRDVS